MNVEKREDLRTASAGLTIIFLPTLTQWVAIPVHLLLKSFGLGPSDTFAFYALNVITFNASIAIILVVISSNFAKPSVLFRWIGLVPIGYLILAALLGIGKAEASRLATGPACQSLIQNSVPMTRQCSREIYQRAVFSAWIGLSIGSGLLTFRRMPEQG